MHYVSCRQYSRMKLNEKNETYRVMNSLSLYAHLNTYLHVYAITST